MNISKRKQIETVLLPMSLILMCVLNLCCTDIKAQGVDFKTGSWEEIKAMAKTQNKLIFVDTYTSWCGPCKMMDKEVFSDKNVGGFYNENFMAFKIDAEKGEGPDFAKHYKVTSYPYLLFIDGDGKQVNKHTGALSVEDFLRFGKETLSSEKEFETSLLLYNKGEREAEFILKHLALLKGRGLPTDAIALEYFNKMDKASWGLPENIKLIQNYIHSPYNKVVDYLVAYKEPIGTSATPLKYMTLFDIYGNYIKTTIKTNNDKEKDTLILSKIKSSFYPVGRDLLTFRAKRVMFARNKDWKRYAKTIIDYVNTHYKEKPEAFALNNLAYLFYKNVTNKNDLSLALNWMNIVLNITDKDSYNYWNFLDTKASVLYKMGKKTEALEVAQTAIEEAKKQGADSKGTLALIDKIKALK